MIAILKKEISSFFASPIGYLVIAIFLLLNGLFLWIFKGEFNVLDNGFADLGAFFKIAPWILIFLIPAVSMKSFADEKKNGTLELLLTKPISKLEIILGKYFGALTLMILALIPSLIYIITVYQLGNPVGNMDMGSTLGSYLGLLFLASAYAAIGIFSSTLTDNQIVAFITAVFLCFFFYIGWEGIADLSESSWIEKIGMSHHYDSIGQGVFDSRDLIYFLSLILFFLALSWSRVIKVGSTKIFLKTPAIVLVVTVLLNVVLSGTYFRMDLTSDKRFTLSDSSKDIINAAEGPIIIDLFLEGDGFPSEFRRLQTETKQLLQEFSSHNPLIKYSFINPLAEETDREQVIQQLSQRGMTPMQLSVQEKGRTSQEVIFPWALASYQDYSVIIPLIKNKIGANQEELVSSSVQNLEYAFADGFSKLLFPKSRKIAVLKGNGELENRFIADFVTTLRDYYFIAPFTLDSVQTAPQRTLDNLNTFDLIISAKPTKPFSEEEKFVLDQYTMQGGKSLWLTESVLIDQDSLMNEEGKAIAVPLDLNMTDFFFRYGIRINPVLVNDLYSAPIALAAGEGSQAQFTQLPWFYSPLINPHEEHPIVKNLNLVKFDFASQIDTLKNPISKSILLQSSLLSKIDGVPREISLDMATKEPEPALYTQPNQTLAVLLEGQFQSVYTNRVKPLNLKSVSEISKPTKMVIISDGDVIKNEIDRNGIVELGFDRWSGQLYGNKEFLLNAVNYLLDDSGLINLRSKTVEIAFLDQEKIGDSKSFWQVINVILPLLILAVFGWLFNYLRRKQYGA